jgi:hypothetical protein
LAILQRTLITTFVDLVIKSSPLSSVHLIIVDITILIDVFTWYKTTKFTIKIELPLPIIDMLILIKIPHIIITIPVEELILWVDSVLPIDTIIFWADKLIFWADKLIFWADRLILWATSYDFFIYCIIMAVIITQEAFVNRITPVQYISLTTFITLMALLDYSAPTEYVVLIVLVAIVPFIFIAPFIRKTMGFKKFMTLIALIVLIVFFGLLNIPDLEVFVLLGTNILLKWILVSIIFVLITFLNT